MGNVIGNILPSAIGVAISPVPIIAVTLMPSSQRAMPVIMVNLSGRGASAAQVNHEMNEIILFIRSCLKVYNKLNYEDC
jgi:hypothetical protein